MHITEVVRDWLEKKTLKEAAQFVQHKLHIGTELGHRGKASMTVSYDVGMNLLR